ncbi:MAG: cytochrome c [Nodularia sp. (in: Bacteria)]|nr:MAG: cytochrome c [Nodularia sp. (in: cyanobacteria)]
MRRFFRLSIITLFVTLLTVSLISPGQTQETNPPVVIPGPWGDIVDPVTPQEFGSDAERITFYRRQQMRTVSGHFRSLEGIIDHDAPFPKQALNHVEALKTIAEYFPELFPSETAADEGEKGAKPLIWQESEKFAQHIQGFQESLISLEKSLQEPLESGSASAGLVAVRYQCLACHQSYRVR